MSPYPLLAHLLQRRIPLHARAFCSAGRVQNTIALESRLPSTPEPASVPATSARWCAATSLGFLWPPGSIFRGELGGKQASKKFRPLWDQPCQQPGWWRGSQVRGVGASSPDSSSPRSALRVGLTLRYHNVLGFCCGQHFVTIEVKEREVFRA